jgi:spoIIIJ-associated protein
MREVERSAPSVEEAIEAALQELGVSEQEARVEILQEPRHGILGIGAQPAVVKVVVPEEGPSEDVLDDQAEIAADFLEGLLERMGLDAAVDHELIDGTMYVDILGPEENDEGMGILIGRHGATLDALQEVVRAVVQRRSEERCLVIVDVEDYRKRRRSQLAGKAVDLAKRVRRTGRPERLGPMTAYERKIVHDAVADIGGVETASEGEEPERRVVIRKERR